MLMYNLVEYSSNYTGTTGSFWFYSEDEATNSDADIGNNNAFKSFEFKAKLLESMVTDGNNSILKMQSLYH